MCLGAVLVAQNKRPGFFSVSLKRNHDKIFGHCLLQMACPGKEPSFIRGHCVWRKRHEGVDVYFLHKDS